jgi:hypothetical protein
LPADITQIALSTGVPEEPLSRLLGALWELGLIEPHDGGIWRTTSRGQLLDPRAGTHFDSAVLEHGFALREQWSRLGEVIRSGGSRASDPFSDIAAMPARVEQMQRMLSAYARHDYPPTIELMPFGQAQVIVDVGGGLGSLAQMMAKRFPRADVWVVERPEVCELARSLGIPNRVHHVSGDLFGPWPVRPDAFVMARVLHDWDDEHAVEILHQARASMAVGGIGVVIELLLSDATAFGRLCDLHLMVTTGGRERTADEYARLVSSAGFRLVRVEPTCGIMSVLVMEVI